MGPWVSLPLVGPDWPVPAVPCASESLAMTGNTGCVFSDTVTGDIPWISALTGYFSQEFSVFLLSRLLYSQEILEAVTFFWGNYCSWDRNLSILRVMVRHFPEKNRSTLGPRLSHDVHRSSLPVGAVGLPQARCSVPCVGKFWFLKTETELPAFQKNPPAHSLV